MFSPVPSLGDEDANMTTKLHKTTPIQFLRALSHCMSLGPALIFCDIDLTTMHVDMDIELEVFIQLALRSWRISYVPIIYQLSQPILAVGPRPSTLARVEEFVYALCRSSTVPFCSIRRALWRVTPNTN
jgi:hypothetical protein